MISVVHAPKIKSYMKPRYPQPIGKSCFFFVFFNTFILWATLDLHYVGSLANLAECSTSLPVKMMSHPRSCNSRITGKKVIEIAGKSNGENIIF